MKTKIYYLILAIVTVILCVSALAKVELYEPDQRGLLVQHNPAFTGIQTVLVAINARSADPNKYIWVRRDLDWKLIDRLQKTGLKVNPSMGGNFWNSAVLRVNLDLLNLQTSQEDVFHVQVFLERTVNLPRQPNLHLNAVLWKSKPVMQAASAKDIPAKVTNIVLQQTESFISAWLAANPQGVKPVDTNEAGLFKKDSVRPAPKSPTAGYMYVASKNSEVFHEPQCRWVNRIASKNLVTYKSRNDAVNAGKRPCKICKP